MSANPISLVEFALTLGRNAEPHLDRIHPSGADIIYEWLREMLCAAELGDALEVKRLAGNVQEKLRLERLWRIQSWASAYPDHHPRVTAWLHEELAHA